MDAKALAKSKRNHTQHNKKSHGSHHGQKLKAPSHSSSDSNDTSKKKQLGNNQQVIENKKGSSTLPSNWDRYEEEELEFGSEGVSVESESKTLDVVVPKSKGADFRHLVAEAQSHTDTTFQGFPSLDDLPPWEFGVGLDSLLAVRGEGILSWVGDDNFVVEDKTSAHHQEASFMSLNLHAVAETLAKVDLSKRLFIESDLLPTELCVEDMAVGNNEEPDQLETAEDSEVANRMSKESNLDDFAADQFASVSSNSSSHSASTFTLFNDFQQVGSSGKNKAILPSAEANLHSTKDTSGKRSTFEAATAEKELDMLLDSLGETKILDSSGSKSNASVQSKIASVTASLDDALDSLLEETSSLMNPNVSLKPRVEKPVHHNTQSSSQSGSKSKVLDDFDSWFDTL